MGTRLGKVSAFLGVAAILACLPPPGGGGKSRSDGGLDVAHGQDARTPPVRPRDAARRLPFVTAAFSPIEPCLGPTPDRPPRVLSRHVTDETTTATGRWTRILRPAARGARAI